MSETVRLARAALALAVDRVFPSFCLGCGRRLAAGGSPLLLCTPCRGRLERIDPRASCAGCARPLPAGRSERPRCVECLGDPPAFASVTAIWRYRPPLDAVVRALKFGRLDFLAEALVDEALAGRPAAGGEPPGTIVPVPLPWPRRLARGFNQAERIGAALARRTGAPCRELLARGWRSPPQHRLDRRDRRARRALELAARPAAGASSGRILLVDDVVTTGSTLRACATALRSAGCASVEAWALAATPPAGWQPARGGAAGLRRHPGGALPSRLDSPCPPP